MIWEKPVYFVHPKFTLHCMFRTNFNMSSLLVLVLDMKVLDVLKYFLIK